MALQSTSLLAGITTSLIGIRQNQDATITALRELAKARNSYNQQKQVDPSTQRTANVAGLRRGDLANLQNTSAGTRAQVENGISALNTVLERLDDLEAIAVQANGASTSLRETLQLSARSTIGEIAAGIATTNLSDTDLLIDVTRPRETLAGITFTRVDRKLDSEGLTFDFEIDTAATFSQLTSAVDLSATATPGTLDDALSFELSGVDGSLAFSFNAGDTLNTILSAVNAQLSQTGVEASINGNTLDFQARDIGSNTIGIIATNDPAGVVTSGQNTGSDTIINIDVDGRFYQGIEGDGLRVAFDVAGTEGFVDVRTDAVDTDVSNVTLNGGGKTALGTDGRVISRFGFAALDVGLIGAQRGGLGSIDLLGDPENAIRIINAARSDVQESIGRATQFRDTSLDSQVNASLNAVAGVQTAILDLKSVTDAVNSLSTVRTETQFANAFTLLAQNAGLYTASAVSLL